MGFLLLPFYILYAILPPLLTTKTDFFYRFVGFLVPTCPLGQLAPYLPVYIIIFKIFFPWGETVSDLIFLRVTARLSVAQAANLFEVSQRTWRAWERGERPPQRGVILYLEVLCGDLSAHGWPGWQIVQGELINAQGQAFTPDQVNALPWLRQLIKAYQVEIRTLEKYQRLNTASNDKTLTDVLRDLTLELD